MVSTKIEVDIMEDTKRASRRPHSAELKARVLEQCSQPGASVAQVALSHGLNANLVHKWRRAAKPANARSGSVAYADEGGGAFIALALPAQVAPGPLPNICVQLRRGGTSVNIQWPVQGGSDCAAWLREWLR